MSSAFSRKRVLIAVLVAVCALIVLKFGPTSRAARSDGVLRGPATIVLQDAYDLPAHYERSRLDGVMRPTTLATADFDVDGFPDLVSGYATGKGGYLVIQRGNPEAFAPTLAENIEAIGESQFPVTFLPETKVVELTSVPDFIVVGDFNLDTDPDVIAAARGGREFYFMAGDGDGSFTDVRVYSITGEISAMSSGQVGLTDGKTDLVLGLSIEGSGEVEVFNGMDGINGKPEMYSMAARPDTITLGELDGILWADAAIVAGGEVFVLHGRNQFDGAESKKSATSRLERIATPFSARAIAIGEFVADRDRRSELAVLGDGGSIAFLMRGVIDTRPLTVDESRERRRSQMDIKQTEGAYIESWKSESSEPWSVAETLQTVEFARGERMPTIFRANLSGNAADDLIVVDPGAASMRLFAIDNPDDPSGFKGSRAQMDIQTGDVPVAALSMQTGLFARPGIVFLSEGKDSPTIISSAPTATFDVDRTDDTNAAAAQVCSAAINDCSLRGAITKANGAVGADTINIPAGTYTLTIANAGGLNEDANATGDLDVGGDTTLNGASAATTIIQAGTTNANGIDKVMGLNPICTSNASFSVNNLTLQFGRNTQAFASSDFGYLNSGLNWCNLGNGTASFSNLVITSNTSVDGYGGGFGLGSAPGDTSTVTVTGVTSSNNVNQRTSGGANGAGMDTGLQFTNATYTNCQVLNNQITGAGQGGGFFVGGTTSQTSQVQIHGTTFSGNTTTQQGAGLETSLAINGSLIIDQDSVFNGNTSQGTAFAAEGGGIYANIQLTSTLTINEVTFTNNVSSTTAATQRGGGGIGFGNGNASVTFCRFFGNTAGGGAGFGGTAMHKDLNPGVITATNNWFGCNGGPNTAGCQTTVVGGTGSPGVPAAAINTNPWLILRHSASPSTIVTGQTSGLTADFLQNSSGGAIAVANLDALIGTTIGFGSPVLGTLSAAQTTIQSNGTATATFTATGTGAGSAGATVDNQTTTAAITINKASTTASIISDSPDPSNVGQNVTVNYSVAVTAPGGGTPGGNVQVSDGVNSCSGTVAAGSCSVALNTAGNRTLTATYQGDTNYNASAPSAGAGHLVGTVTWTGATDTNYATGTNWNTGLAPGSADTVVIPSGATNQPSITSANFSAASLSVASGRTLTITSPRTLTVSGTLTNNGTIGGTGTIVNNFTNAGTVAPGLSPGVLNITGTYTSNGSLNMEIGGTGGAGVTPNGHDQLLVSGAATLGGTLNVTLTNGFTPATGNSFVIFDAASIAGTFTTTNLPNISPNTWNVLYNNVAGTLTLVVNPPTAAGVSVSGRVMSASGRPVRSAVVTLTDDTGATRTVITGSQGGYRFDDVEVGRTYIVSVRSRRFTFQPRVVAVSDELTGLDIVAEP